VPSAIVAVAAGFVLGFWGDEFLPGVFYNTLPLPVVAGLVADIGVRRGRDALAPAAGSPVPAETVTGTAPGSPATQQATQQGSAS
jgi:hypothetical protein